MSAEGPSPLAPAPVSCAGSQTVCLTVAHGGGHPAPLLPTAQDTDVRGCFLGIRTRGPPSACMHHRLHVNKSLRWCGRTLEFEKNCSEHTCTPTRTTGWALGEKESEGNRSSRVSKQEACALKTLQSQDKAGHGKSPDSSLSNTVVMNYKLHVHSRS